MMIHVFFLFLWLQSDPELVSAIYGRGIAYGKKSHQVNDIRFFQRCHVDATEFPVIYILSLLTAK